MQDQCILIYFSVLLEKPEKLFEIELSVAIVFKQNRFFSLEKKNSSGDLDDSGLIIEMDMAF